MTEASGGRAAVITVEVGGTYITCGVTAEDGSQRHTERRPTRAGRGPDAVLETVLDCAADLAERFRPAAAGITVPGVVDERAGMAVFAEDLGWYQVPVRQRVSEHLGIPVAVGHDVRAAGLAEARAGAGGGCRYFLYVATGTGIAATMMLGGQALTRSGGGAGELGHIVLRPGGETCPCGGRGCLEAYASATGIARRYTNATGESGITAMAVQERAAGGDQVAAEIWREAIETFADVLAIVVGLLDPERVVIGGPPALAGEHHVALLRAAVAERLRHRAGPAIIPAELGGDAGRRGAAMLAQDLLRREALS
ncbi:ROK family protein [Kitasatospora sp. NPDC087314]|uniref:ROK family protein n=1 Tax=Kitasatospora sp. NPDC087314 TaxID=3364068 RepID=UPI003822DDD4